MSERYREAPPEAQIETIDEANIEMLLEELDINNPEKFIEKHFTHHVEDKESEDGLKYALVEFRPENKGVAEVVRRLQFFLFGGNGNWVQAATDGAIPTEKIEQYKSEWFEKAKKMDDLVENDFDEALDKTEKAIALLNGLFSSIGKESLLHYFSTALHGENQAWERRYVMEIGGNVERHLASSLNQTPKSEFWITSQLSPYTPYLGTLFLHRDLPDRYPKIADKIQKDLNRYMAPKLRKLDPKKFKQIYLQNAGRTTMEKWRVLQALAYMNTEDLHVAVDSDGQLIEADHGGDMAFPLMKHANKNLYSGPALSGWILPPMGEKRADLTDFAMLTDKEFHENGVFKFMIPKHEKSNSQT